jgi:mono/diheme cytochrome c family protein
VLLRRIDRVLAPATWVIAGLTVLVLLVGPELIGAKKSGAAGSAAAPSGQAVFSASCAGCHTLAAAGASGTTGPNLDAARDDAATVEAKVRGGGGAMPAFQGQLDDAAIRAVAEYVAASAGG